VTLLTVIHEAEEEADQAAPCDVTLTVMGEVVPPLATSVEAGLRLKLGPFCATVKASRLLKN
jgi:hypothetical protein